MTISSYMSHKNHMRNYRRARVLVVPLFIAFALVIGAHDVWAVPCTHGYIPASPVPAGFGAAFNITGSQELLVRGDDCTDDAYAVRVGSGASVMFVYRHAYYWTGSSWQHFTLDGGMTTGNGDWFIGTAAGTFDPTVRTGTFVLGYVCQQRGDQWLCGCSDAACLTSNWQLQRLSH